MQPHSHTRASSQGPRPNPFRARSLMLMHPSNLYNQRKRKRESGAAAVGVSAGGVVPNHSDRSSSSSATQDTSVGTNPRPPKRHAVPSTASRQRHVHATGAAGTVSSYTASRKPPLAMSGYSSTRHPNSGGRGRSFVMRHPNQSYPPRLATQGKTHHQVRADIGQRCAPVRKPVSSLQPSHSRSSGGGSNDGPRSSLLSTSNSNSTCMSNSSANTTPACSVGKATPWAATSCPPTASLQRGNIDKQGARVQRCVSSVNPSQSSNNAHSSSHTASSSPMRSSSSTSSRMPVCNGAGGKAGPVPPSTSCHIGQKCGVSLSTDIGAPAAKLGSRSTLDSSHAASPTGGSSIPNVAGLPRVNVALQRQSFANKPNTSRDSVRFELRLNSSDAGTLSASSTPGAAQVSASSTSGAAQAAASFSWDSMLGGKPPSSEVHVIVCASCRLFSRVASCFPTPPARSDGAFVYWRVGLDQYKAVVSRVRRQGVCAEEIPKVLEFRCHFLMLFQLCFCVAAY